MSATKKPATKKQSNKPAAKAAKQANPVERGPSAVEQHATVLTDNGKHKRTRAAISDARRALHEPNSACRKALERGPVDIDKLAEMMEKTYGVPRGVFDQQIRFEIGDVAPHRKTRVLKLSANKLTLIDANRGFAFRRALKQ